MSRNMKGLSPDFCDTFNIYIKWTRIAGLDILDEDPRGYKKYFLFIFSNICAISVVISSAYHVILMADSSLDIIRDFLCITVDVQNHITLLVMAYKSSKIKKLFFDVAELWPSYHQDGPKTELFNKWLRRYVLYSKAYARFFIFGVICFNLKPLPFVIYSYFTDPDINYEEFFVFNLYRPWAMTSLLRYLLGLSYDAIATSVIHICVHTAFVMILTGLTYDISLMFRLLQIDLENCFECCSNVNEDGNIDDKEATKALVAVVKTHQKLLRISQDLNDNFGVIILISYAVSVFLICTTMFMSVVIDSVNSFAVFITLAEVFSLSWPGQLLTEMSGKMAECAYRSLWYNSGKKHSGLILMIILRSQKPAVLSGMGFCNSSLATFASILRLSWSYFNLLIQVFKDNDATS